MCCGKKKKKKWLYEIPIKKAEKYFTINVRYNLVQN